MAKLSEVGIVDAVDANVKEEVMEVLLPKRALKQKKKAHEITDQQPHLYQGLSVIVGRCDF